MDWIWTFPVIKEIGEWSAQLISKAISTGSVPNHIAFIMDGNRTFARQKLSGINEGHAAGFDSMTNILGVCYKSGVRCATVFAFSTENFKRSNNEINALMELAKNKMKIVSNKGELCEKYGVKIRIIGDLSLVSDDVKNALLKVEKDTEKYNYAILNVCFCYTSRADIVQSMYKNIVNGDSDNITEESISNDMWTGPSNCPKADLIIRTAGVRRLSDFLLWEASDSSTIEFIDVLWPEFGVFEMLKILIKWPLRKGPGIRDRDRDRDIDNDIDVADK